MAGMTDNASRSDGWKWILLVLAIPIIAVSLFIIFVFFSDVQDPFAAFSPADKIAGTKNWAILLLAAIAVVLFIIEQFMPEDRRPFARGIRWFFIFLLVILGLFGYFPTSLNTLLNTALNSDYVYGRWFLVVTGAFLAVYPITFLAYRWNVHPRLIKRLENEIKFLGLDEEDYRSQNKKLIDKTFSSWHFWLFIIPIIAVSLVIVLGYLMPEKLPGGEELVKAPMQLVFFSLLGAYVFSVQELVRRYQTNDLRPQVYATILVRIVIAAAITFAAASVIYLAASEVPPSILTATVTPTPTETLTATNGAEATADSPVIEAEKAEATQAAAEAEAALAIVGGTATIAAAEAAVDVAGVEVEATISAVQKSAEIAVAQATATAEANLAAEVEESENGEAGATPAPMPGADDDDDDNEPSEPASGADGWAIVLAFLIGMIPARGTRWMSQRTSSVLGNEQPITRIEPLSNLTGISQWHESRLLEMGIDNVQNLATANILELLLTTRFSAEQIINWIDQAILYTRIGPNKFVTFGEHGINTYSDFKARLNSLPLPAPNSGGPSPAEILSGQLGLANEQVLYTLGDAGSYANYLLIQTYYRNRAIYTEDSAAEGLASLIGEEGPNALTPAERSTRYLDRLRNQEASLTASLQSWPRNAEKRAILAAIRLNIGQVTADDAKMTQAVTDSLEALAQNPALVDARITLGWAYHYLRQYNEAISVCNVAIQWDASRKEPYLIRGLSILEQAVAPATVALSDTLLESAKADFNTALELDNRCAEAYLGQGRALTELNEYLPAIESFKKYLLLGDRENPKFWLNWARALQNAGQYPEARENLDQALAIQPNNAEARYLRAIAHRELGNRDPAIVDLRVALSGVLSPEQQQAARAGLCESLRTRATIRSNIGEWPAALADYKEMLSHCSDSAQQGLDIYIGNAFVHATTLPQDTPEPALAIYEWILRNAPDSLYYGPARIAWEQLAGTTWPEW